MVYDLELSYRSRCGVYFKSPEPASKIPKFYQPKAAGVRNPAVSSEIAFLPVLVCFLCFGA